MPHVPMTPPSVHAPKYVPEKSSILRFGLIPGFAMVHRSMRSSSAVGEVDRESLEVEYEQLETWNRENSERMRPSCGCDGAGCLADRGGVSRRGFGGVTTTDRSIAARGEPLGFYR